jgi:type II secretory pathway predicted ATPase ExeA
MYESFYRFRSKPFSLLPDPEFLFLSTRHKAGLSVLEYGLLNRAAFTVLTGEPGTGKTTLLNKVLEQSAGRCLVGMITTTHPNADTLLPWVADAFGLNGAGQDAVGYVRAFTAFLGRCFAAGRQVLLVVDEAQNLNLQMLEELRLLSNVNDGRQSGIQIMLAGQPTLRAVLTRPDMRQLAQRVAVDYALEPLGEDDTLAYIRHRLRVAGGDPALFTGYACSLLHQFSGGTPRVINQLCDLSLAYGFGEGAERISSSLVRQVAMDRAVGGILPSLVDPRSIQLDPVKVQEETGSVEPPVPKPAPPITAPLPAVPPEDGYESYREALALKKAGQYRQALKKLDQAGQDPAYRFKTAAQRGLCLRAIGKLEDAASSFRHALDVNGAKAADLLNVRYVLALTLDQLGRTDAAQEQYRQIHRTNPTFRDIAARLEPVENGRSFPFSWFYSLRQNWQQFRGASQPDDVVLK